MGAALSSPVAMQNALRKVYAMDFEVSNEYSHFMFFGTHRRLFATHPSLTSRHRALKNGRTLRNSAEACLHGFLGIPLGGSNREERTHPGSGGGWLVYVLAGLRTRVVSTKCHGNLYTHPDSSCSTFYRSQCHCGQRKSRPRCCQHAIQRTAPSAYITARSRCRKSDSNGSYEIRGATA